MLVRVHLRFNVVVFLLQDENVASDDEDDENEDEDVDGTRENHEGGDLEEEDDGRHARMLQEITGLPSDAFEGNIEPVICLVDFCVCSDH